MSLTTGLLRAYNFEGNSTDLVGGYNGTDTSVSYSTSYGKILQGVHTTGSGSYITATNTSLPLGSSSWSVCMYIKTTSSATSSLYGYGTVSSFGFRNCMLIVSGKAYFSGFGVDLDSGFTVNDGNPHTIEVTYDGTTLKIYVDGSLKNSGTVSLNVQSGTSLYIGSEPTLGSYYVGDMDMLYFWNRELTSAEALEYHNLASQYPFNNANFMSFM